jgi:hypothetical protein
MNPPSIHLCPDLRLETRPLRRLGPRHVSIVELAPSRDEWLGHTGLGEAHSE